MKKEVRYFAQDGENIFYLSSSVCAVLSLKFSKTFYNQKYEHQIWREVSLCHQTENILKYSNQLSN